MTKPTLALLYGCICHLSFVLGVGLMMYSIYFGLDHNLFGLHSWGAWFWNAFIVLQFPFLHSFFLHPKGKKFLALLAPKEVRSELSTTLFAWFASVQLILVFGTWAGSGHLLWQPQSEFVWILMSVCYALSWVLLLKAMSDANLALQTGLLGWLAVFRKRKPVYKKFPTSGLNRFTRNPIYVAFCLILWTAPVWTWDRVFLVVPWTLYCFLGPLLKEKRYRRYFGAEYLDYQKRVPFWIPKLKP